MTDETDKSGETMKDHPLGELLEVFYHLDPNKTYSKAEILDLMGRYQLARPLHLRDAELESYLQLEVGWDGQLTYDGQGQDRQVFRGSHWQKQVMDRVLDNPGHPFGDRTIANSFFVLIPVFLRGYLNFCQQHGSEPDQGALQDLYARAIVLKGGPGDWSPERYPHSHLSVLWSWLRGFNHPFYLHSLVQLIPMLLLDPPSPLGGQQRYI